MKKIRQIIVAGLLVLACSAPEGAMASAGTATNANVSNSALGISATEIWKNQNGTAPSEATIATIEGGRQITQAIKTFEKIIYRTESTSGDYVSEDAAPIVSYKTYVQNSGWQNAEDNGAISGTTGQDLQMEGVQIRLNGLPYQGSISYRTRLQDTGWTSFVSNGSLSGTEGEGKRLEAIEMKLSGEIAVRYEVYYRTYAQQMGWLDWAKNGETAGTEGFSYPLEAIEVLLVKKGDAVAGKTENRFVKRIEPVLSYASYIQNEGWQNPVSNRTLSGTSEQAKQLEGITIHFSSQPYAGSIVYRTSVTDHGWLDWVKDGEEAGLTGNGKGIEAIEIALDDEMATQYDVYYQVYVQNIGWLDWAMNGATAGTAGYAYALDGIQIQMVPKGGASPGNLATPFMKKIPEKIVEIEIPEPDILEPEKPEPEKPEPAIPEPEIPEPEIAEPEIPEPEIPEPEISEPEIPEPQIPELLVFPGGPDWSVRNGYFETAYGTQYYVGNSYIVISLSYQTVWAYIGNDEIVEAPVITGRPSMPTPTGLFYIQPYKASPSVLTGEDYASPVQYWIPFLGNSYGLHDASWQTSGFGGDLYQYIGSHGCVNTPYYAVETLYYTYPIGTPVVVY